MTVHSRSELISRLMRERQVARFLVAPSGYGKTYVALEYAQVIFGFEDVSWITAQSPCFLRDLDSGRLAQALMTRDRMLKLVVFDDVPRLGSARASMFSQAIDDLLENSIEVVVTCHPSCDAYSGRQIDRICLHSRDLLLSEAEVEAAGFGSAARALAAAEDQAALSEGEKRELALRAQDAKQGGSDRALQERIPQLVWGGTTSLANFAMGIKREDLPSESLAAMFLLLSLRQAGLSWVCEQFGLQAENVLLLAHDYPHLGLWREGDSFETIDIPQKILYQVFSLQIEEIMGVFGIAEVDDLAWRIADTLMDLAQPGRACEHIREFCRKGARAEWVKARTQRLFAARCTLPAHYASRSAVPPNGNGAVTAYLEARDAWRLRLLGDSREAVKCAMHAAGHPAASPDDRAWALLLLASQPLKKAVLEGVFARLQLLVESAGKVEGACERDWYAPAVFAVEANRAKEEAPDAEFMATWGETLDQGEVSGVRADLALWCVALALEAHPQLASLDFVRECALQAEEEFTTAHVLAFRAFKDFAEHVEASEAVSGAVSMVTPEALQAAEDIRGFMTVQVMANMHEAEEELMAEIRAYQSNNERTRRAAARKKRSAIPAPMSLPGDELDSLPQLTINVLGGFEVLLDGKPVASRVFGQAKVRALLALLVVSDGRECSKANVVEALWPDLSDRSGLKNLYTTWSNLARALSLPDGSNPYLVRSQGSYRLVKHCVDTDVARVNRICREVTMGQTTQERLCELLNELNHAYKGDLLPSETKNEWILKERRQYRHQVTNLFANAALQLVDMNQSQAALWFSQIAMRHEAKREEMYYALMSSQLACGQREAALETYHSCMKMLTRQYQIDPSIRMVTLYNSILEHESSF